DLTAALRRAAAILERAPNEARRIYLFSDGSASSIRTGERPWPDTEGAPELHVVDVSDGQPLPNTAIVGTRVSADARLGARGVEIIADIANFGDGAIKGLGVTLAVGGVPVARGLVDLKPHERVAKRFAYTFPGGGVFDATVELADDNLPIDNKRYLRVEVRK